MKFICVIVALAIITIFLYESAKLEIGDNDQVVITQFGKVSGPAYTVPGEYFKLPIIQKANYYKKNQFLSELKQEIPTKEYEIIFWQSKCLWKIIDPIKFYQTLNSYKLAKRFVVDDVGHRERTIISSYEFSDLLMSREYDEGRVFKCPYEIEYKIKELSQHKLDVFGIKLVGYEAQIQNIGRKMLPDNGMKKDGL